MWSNILSRISYTALFLVVVLLPVFFLPFTNIPVEVSKGLLLVVGLSISVIFWSVARFSDGKVSFPRSNTIFAAFLVGIAFLLSAFFSSASQTSFFGIIFDVGTFWFMFAAILLMFIASVMVRDARSSQMLLFGVILSTVVVMIFQIFRFFLPVQTSLGVLGSNADNLVGSLNSLGLLAGFTCLASLFIIEFFSVTRLAKILLGLFVLISLFVMAAVNYMLVWELVGVFALFIFVYKISFFGKGREDSSSVHFPAFAFAVVMLSLLFFMSGQFIGGMLPSRLAISNTEVSPSLSATMMVTKESIKKDPLFGIGPNRFGEAWGLYKPASINSSIFWDTSFNSGSGLLPTLASTTGLLGILSWVLFLVALLASGIKSIFRGTERHSMHREMTAFFLLALYLLASAFFYSSGSVIILLAFAFIGVFVGLLSNKDKGEYHISFLDDHRKSFFFILSLVLIMILSAAAAFKYIERFASVSHYRKSLQAPTVAEAEASINKALALHQNDLYLRTYAQIYVVKLNNLLAEDRESLTEAEKAELQQSFDKARAGVLAAINYNPNNYLNHQTLGNLYSVAGVLGVKDAYSEAVKAYEAAALLNPQNPGIKLSIARAYASMDQNKQAKEAAEQALSLKTNYIEALVFLSQMATREGDREKAISYAEQALAFAPSNEDLIKYVDSLKAGN